MVSRRAGASMWVWKVATVLLYGDLPAIERIAPGSLLVHTSQLAAHLRIRPYRLTPYLEQLQALGVIQSLTIGRGYVSIKLCAPIGYEPAGVIDVGVSSGRAPVIQAVTESVSLPRSVRAHPGSTRS